MPISIEDIKKVERNKKEIKKEIYTKIYELFSKKIKVAVDLGHKQVFLRVPSFLLGYPTYNLEKAANYVYRQFERSGFEVYKTSTIDLYVSWNIKKKKNKSEHSSSSSTSVEDDSLPTLMNLKKLASKYKNA
jgi:hypothetical protein